MSTRPGIPARTSQALTSLGQIPPDPRRWPRPVRLALLVLAALALLAALWPYAAWAYHIDQAGRDLEQGLRWPTPRLADSLPTVGDAKQLDAALAHLEAATLARPGHAYAYRLAGDAHMARGEWRQAAASFERAHWLAPAEPLPAWQASLAYEQLQAQLDGAPERSVLELFAAGQLSAPGQMVRSQFCDASGAASCYFGRTAYAQANLDDPDGGDVRRDVLFLHPTARLSAALDIPQDLPILRFAVGLDPVARDWTSDGATFRILVGAAGGEEQALALPVDAAAARLGWVRGYADLRRWAGQRVTVTLETGPGRAGDPTDDWYGWGDLALTTPEAMDIAPLHPQRRMAQLWLAAGQNSDAMKRNRDEARAVGADAEAAVWERRMLILQELAR